MGIFTSPRSRYIPPLGRDDSNPDNPPDASSTFLGRPPPAENDWLSRLAPQWPYGSAQDPNIVKVADPGPGPDEPLPSPQAPRRGIFPSVELPPGTPLKNGPGQPVVLPDGSRVPDRYSPTGQLMSPVGDLSEVAAAGRRTADQYRSFAIDPMARENAGILALWNFARNIGTGGKYDYQRQGNQLLGHVFGFTQLPQFRNVANVNVDLFSQQAGRTLEQTLTEAGEYASHFSSNYRPDQPYGLDPRTAEFITLGFNIGKSGAFDPRPPWS